MKILALTNRISALTNWFSGRNVQKTNSNLLKFGMVLLFSVTLWGCGKGNAAAPVTIDPITGKHSTGWFDVGSGGAHPAAYFADPGSCEGCHGKDLKGGISKVSCSPGLNNTGCHDIFPHAAGFNVPAAHGKFATGVLTSNGVFGMAHCQKCHGLDYLGGVGPSCIKCHRERGSNPATNAPHGANWKISGRHSKSDVTNAAACFKCHAGGASSHPAQSPALPGTEPGCFNGTLCHNVAIAHAVPFINATSHGKAIKITSGWASCGNCHAAPSNGFPRYNVSIGSMTTGCETCHTKPNLAHPQMWLSGRGDGTPTAIGGSVLVKNTSHIDVPAENIITSCTICHGITAPSANSVVPSCATASGQLIGGIRCHFTSPVNSTGKSVGCTSCHGAPPSGDAALPATTAPNRAYRHTVHWAIPAITCDACHNGKGPNGATGNATHATGGVAETAFPAKFNENGLAASYSPTVATTGKCANVSCHGGKNTTFPLWNSAAIFNQATCTNCHIAQIGLGVLPSVYTADPTSPYIGPFSGNNGTTFANNLHTAHIFLINPGNPSAACLSCHGTPGAGHYANIMSGRRLFQPGFAAGTITGTGIVYNPITAGCTTNVGCHIFPDVPRPWNI